MSEHYNDVNYPLTDVDMKKILKTYGLDINKIRTYDDLKNYNSLSELMPLKKDFVIIHVPTNLAKNVGHWIGIIKQPNKEGKSTYILHDPYGKKLDASLYFSPKKLRKEIFNEPYLSYLFNKAKKEGETVLFNSVEYQNYKDINSSTCGRHVLMRIISHMIKNITDGKSYYDYMNKLKKKYEGYSYDQIVARLMNPNEPQII